MKVDSDVPMTLVIARFFVRHWMPLVLLQLLAITTLSLVPLPELPALPGTDKTHHLLAYGCLMFTVAFAKPPTWVHWGLSFLLWSGLIELIQPLVNRHGEWLDLFANAGGLIIGSVLAFALRRIR